MIYLRYMDEEKRQEAQEQIDPRFGELKMMWTMPEYHIHDRGIWWYIGFVILGIGLILSAVFTANYAFAVIIVLIWLLMILEHYRNPEDVPVVLLSTGVAVGNHFHEWKDVRDFSIAYKPPEVQKLYIDFHKLRHPLMSVDIPDNIDPNEIRAVLKQFVKENLERDEEIFADYVRRLYKL